MPRPGYASITVPKDLAAALDEVRARMGLATVRPDDRRRKDSRAIVIERLLQHFRSCPRNGYVPPLELHEEARP